MPSLSPRVRQGALAVALLGVGVTLLRLLLVAPAGSRQASDYAFPQRVPLPGWQQTGSQLLQAAEPSGYRYAYRQDGRSLQIGMHYWVGTVGSYDNYRRTVSEGGLADDPPIRCQSGTGEYRVWTRQQRAHLVGCINAKGPTTADVGGFLAIRHDPGFLLRQLPAWLSGQESLRDRRCLWAHLSVPLEQVPEDKPHAPLEAAWAWIVNR